MKKSNNGFAVLETALLLIVGALIIATGWYIWSANNKTQNTYDQANLAASSSALYTKKNAPPTIAKKVDPYAGWKTYTFAPENLKLKFPSDVNLGKPLNSLGSFDNTGISAGEYASAINKGFHVQIVRLIDPSKSGFGNLDKASEVNSFTSQGTKYYVVNDAGTSLYISTCSDHVCTYKSHSNPKYGMLIFVFYEDPAKSSHQSAERIPINNAYFPTIVKILQSLSY